jgi:integrase
MHAPVCQREQEPKSPFVFVSERGDPFSNRGFQATVERAGKAAGFGMKIHPHMLRHACGYKLANDGVDTRTIQSYLGHKSIQHTVRYTELAPTRFKSLFRDWAVPSIAVSIKNEYEAAWTAEAMSQIHYLPLTPGFFAILVGIFVIVLILRPRFGKGTMRA